MILLIISTGKYIFRCENKSKNVILIDMKTKNILASFIALLIFSGCAIITDEYQANQRKVIAFLLEDLPLPEDAKIIKAPTVLLGTGESISGRIILKSGYSPAENLIFYGTETLSTGWQLVSSKVGEEVKERFSSTYRELVEEIEEKKREHIAKEDKEILSELFEFYKSSEIYRVAGAELEQIETATAVNG